jgi:hydrogenase/urease accessory protein HupE
MRALGAFLLILLLAPFTATPAHAHALQPGYLELTPITGDTTRVYWRVPDVQGRAMPISPSLPENCTQDQEVTPVSDGSAWSATWAVDCPGGMAGGKISVLGLDRTQTDVLVRYEDLDGAVLTERLTPERTAFVVTAEITGWAVLASYVPLGVDHILSGIDHLLFVFALLLLIPDARRLIGAITAFTVAHSLTMAAATLGWVSLPPLPVEAVIALSIMFLASELVRRETGSLRLSEAYPWTVSFSFGLLHGFGFAGALKEIGLPQSDVPLALLSFNLGVEIGQLLFVASVLVIGYILRRIVPRFIASVRRPGSGVAQASAYLIGGVSAAWFVERIVAFWA